MLSRGGVLAQAAHVVSTSRVVVESGVLLLTFVLIGGCELLQQVVGTDAAKEHMVFRESWPRYLGAQRLDVLSCRADEINSLQVLHRLVFRIHPLHKVHLLLQDLGLRVHHCHDLRSHRVQQQHLHPCTKPERMSV